MEDFYSIYVNIANTIFFIQLPERKFIFATLFRYYQIISSEFNAYFFVSRQPPQNKGQTFPINSHRRRRQLTK